jgi:hypothetical protein
VACHAFERVEKSFKALGLQTLIGAEMVAAETQPNDDGSF